MADAGRAAVVRIEALRKGFGDVVAVDDVSLEIREGEFFALLGPSGCGKTTLLRMIAGLEVPDGGRILIDGRDMTATPPNRRPVNMVFQSYALFPHMTVEENVAYGLRVEGCPRGEMERRVREALRLVRLEELRKRRPDALSGGQRQRVALARALVKRPRVLLLDEPLSALDAKLREEMQLELSALQARLGLTFVIVTHDQDEALSMADRIAVMRAGRIEQVDIPEGLYERPANRFVAGFIGRINMFGGRLLAVTDNGYEVEARGLGRLCLPLSAATSPPPAAPLSGAEGESSPAVTLAIRPEKIAMRRFAPTGTEAEGPVREGVSADASRIELAAQVREWAYYGDISYMVTSAMHGDLEVSVVFANATREMVDEFDIGDTVVLSWRLADMLLLFD
jgi:spermidine/putrescine ABC transporter ATP-binding subunit